MAAPVKKNVYKKSTGSRVAALVILFLVFISVAGYYFFTPKRNPVQPSVKPDVSAVKPSLPTAEKPKKPSQESAVLKAPQKALGDYSTKIDTDVKDKTVVSAAGTTGRLAIVIDDMGSSLSEARSLAAINLPLTFAIIPGLRVDTQVAGFAASNNIQTMIHIPMQSKGWPNRRLEANGLLVSMDADELRERVSGFIAKFPGAIGVNNHMGSEFTEQEDKMTVVLQVMKNKRLFFIDSVTSPESVGWKVAQHLGVKSARRNVFLDNEQDRNYILGQLNQAVRLAKKSGSAIAICHPHQATIAALAAALPGLAGQGVQLVPVSQLVK
jgi:polysaccharide deacetylase 2 family uncharacterized protein YibQ